MLDTHMKPMDQLVLERLPEREGGSVCVNTGPSFRLELAKEFNVHPQDADKLHSAIVRLIDQGYIVKTLHAPKGDESVCVTKVKYTYV